MLKSVLLLRKTYHFLKREKRRENMLKVIEIKQNVFEDNNREADKLRAYLKENKTYLLNLMSSPVRAKQQP